MDLWEILGLVFDEACRSSLSFQSSMSVSNKAYWSPMRHVGWVSGRNNIFVNSSKRHDCMNLHR